jgi:hypothetical protein
MGAVRLKAAIQLWLIDWQHPELDDYTRHELKLMSASTLERGLKSEKATLRRRTNTGTKQTRSKVKTLIPIRDLEFAPVVPGHCEIDCVAHCGGSLTGNHIWTLTLTDILTGHTECESLEFKNGFEVMLALHRIEDRLPFKIIALYMDNGSEFLNEDVYKRFSQRKGRSLAIKSSTFSEAAHTRKTTNAMSNRKTIRTCERCLATIASAAGSWPAL